MRSRTGRFAAAIAVVALSAAAAPARADYVIYADLPTDASNEISHHQTGGPVLADDFIPALSGRITSVEWWGSAATSPDWEITLHPNASGQPANVPNGHGGYSIYSIATGVADVPGHPDIFHYTANVSGPYWSPPTDASPLGPLSSVNAGTDYWFSVANVSNGWTWALALNGPSVGSELYNAQVSTGHLAPDGGPHGGPWSDVHTDFAFRINAVPEPATIIPGTMGFLGVLGCYNWRRRKMNPVA